MIDRFTEQWDFLSNFYPSPFYLDAVFGCFHTELSFKTAEHAYQSQKTYSRTAAVKIAEAPTAADAKKAGQTAPLRDDWERVKFNVMRNVLFCKFADPKLAEALLSTGNHMLVEGNSWHDQVWGDCRCPRHQLAPGLNALGTILMDFRLDLIAKK